MKKLSMCFLIVILVLVMSCLHAASLNFEPPTGTVVGYIVYYSDGSNNWSKNVGNRTSIDLVEFNLTPGNYSFYVTAYNTIGEGPKSNTVEYISKEYVVGEDNPKPITITSPGPVTINITIQ